MMLVDPVDVKSYPLEPVIQAMVPMMLAYAVLIIGRVNTAYIGGAIRDYAALKKVDFGMLSAHAESVALQLISQQQFFLSLMLAIVPVLIGSEGLAARAGSVGMLVFIGVFWYFRWKPDAVPPGQESRRSWEMFLGSFGVVTINTIVTLRSVW